MNPTTIKSTRERIVKILKEKPHCRDNDNRLTANLWNRELLDMKKPPTEITGFTFLDYFAAGKLTHPETIRRTRQKIQEEQPELRGKKYDQRQAEGEETRKTINQ